MSRSRKKNPIVSHYSRSKSGTRYSKRLASKAVRRYKGEITNGGIYKKIFNSDDIHDFKGYKPDYKKTYRK